MPIQEAIEYLDSRPPGEQFSYREVAKMFNVDRTTLSRRHRGVQRSHDAQAGRQLALNPQQEQESMIQNFGSAVGKWEVSESWITRFLHRHNDKLATKWSAGIDRERHHADSKHKYELYYRLLHSKMREYDIEPQNTYNMDEKGFFIGITTRTKRVFSKAVWASKERQEALRDGNREWVTLLACVCASGEALPPALIYQGTSGIQTSWVDDVMAQQHQVFIGNSPTGWTNNELGLTWLQQVFNRYTKAKAGRSRRLLIVDGHGSHLTSEFLEFCDSQRILLMVFPPHSTHTLQPLDVVLFSPLSRYYTKELNNHLQRTQGITKRDFFNNFWPAWTSTMRPELIMKSFQATGVWPMDADAVLKRFNNHPQQQDEDSEIGEHGDGDSWTQLRKVFEAAVANKAKVEAKRLSQSIHSLQVNNELLHAQNEQLQRELSFKKTRSTQRTTLATRDDNDWHGGAVFMSPGKLRTMLALKAAEQDEAEQSRLQKTHDRELKAAATAHKKQQVEEAKVARQRAVEERRAAKKARAEELAAQRALKKQQREATTTHKSHDTSIGRKRKASHKPAKIPAKRRRVVAAPSRADAGPPAASPPPKTSLRGRNIKTPARFK
ncbi:hypothetical protein G6011_08833 [Alternaria panax]|uniref:DDE-1 domain-containing protein n=1 Tax=Alternaria panax TaxID=48097 RepID=A0AAD4FK11_9PLEO|nr:hypothetical protein G6011_08833 [Alternaria panax]